MKRTHHVFVREGIRLKPERDAEPLSDSGWLIGKSGAYRHSDVDGILAKLALMNLGRATSLARL